MSIGSLQRSINELTHLGFVRLPNFPYRFKKEYDTPSGAENENNASPFNRLLWAIFCRMIQLRRSGI